MAERHEWVQNGCLAGFDQGRWEQIRLGAGVEVKEMDADGNTEVLLAFEFKGTVGQVCEGEVGGGTIGFGQPALMGRGGSFCHGA
jgi:hypothetical protein